ncbi:unnamed protein product [Paramecium sonneborni]|uniref:Uncharacterized protein n=1 Tax=Paramecium sonneborni TaxID=65129 RepID=A0A8S1QZ58_9CILI|nr:unnamed protein product [Paramecium sonneborni]
MNQSEIPSKKICVQQEYRKEIEIEDNLRKVKIQVKYTKDQKIIYSRDEIILRVEENRNSIFNPETFINIEQIKNLEWQIEKGQGDQDIVKWIALWNGEVLMNVGGYCYNGLKQGIWKELIKNYSSNSQVYEVGEYNNGIRIGRWFYIYNNKQINHGYYNEEGVKQGKWIELRDRFMDDFQAYYNGEYNIDGKQIGIWEIMYKQDGEKDYKQIVGGSYHIKENFLRKVGTWIELSEGFCSKSQIIYKGEYNIYGQKIDRWNIMYKEFQKKKYKNLGGGNYFGIEKYSIKTGKWTELSDGYDYNKQVTYIGNYDQEGQKTGLWKIGREGQLSDGGLYRKINGVSRQIGKWVELSEDFNKDFQVTYEGLYNINGQKQGRWDILFEENLVGGGQYDDQDGVSMKIGEWIELFQGFQKNSQVTYQGQYNKRGIKKGRWDIKYCIPGQKEYKQIGGGFYEEQDYLSVKIGNWIELSQGFQKDSQVIYDGEYNRNGIKKGRWDIKYCIDGQNLYKQIGGGSYNQKDGFAIKIGMWIEEWVKFGYMKEVIFKGEYNMKGFKKGRWDILYRKYGRVEYKLLGGGEYQEGNSKKIGKWIELSDNFCGLSQVTYEGEYNLKGKTIGRWDISHDGKQIGGGQYQEQNGISIKVGDWLELSEQFRKFNQIAYQGKYNDQGLKIGKWVKMNLRNQQNSSQIKFKGIKKGRWDIKYCIPGQKEYKQIGGGFYEEQDYLSVKIGNWIELSQGFQKDSQVIYDGEYNRNGIKKGRWDIKYCIDGQNLYKQIGGGSYNQKDGFAIKIGMWIEEWVKFGYMKEVIFKGEYNMKGFKKGRWDILYRKYGRVEYKLLGGGEYQEGNSKKIGKWIELSDNFCGLSQVTYEGEYNLKGKTIGRWDISHDGKQIGGGQYQEQNGISIKVGDWLELSEQFRKFNQIAYQGKYNDQGLKIGKWVKMNLRNQQNSSQIKFKY